MSSTTHDQQHETQSWRHPVNVGHLVMGIAFLAIVGVWALIQTDVVTGEEVRWLMPVPWVLAGLGGLLAIALTGSRRRTTRQSLTDPAHPVVEEVAQQPSRNHPTHPVVEEVAQQPSRNHPTDDTTHPVVEEVAQQPSRNHPTDDTTPIEEDPR